ncbi:MAG: DUF4342 domain-containing protein [Anaerolineae bacterium]|nr:DUF4342 domain-containing protein [Anaerolineae bacterium]
MSEEQKNPETTTVEEKAKTFSEQIEVAGNDLVGRVQDLVKEGNARRLIIRNAENEVMMDINLTVGAVAGGVVVLGAWWIAALAVIAGLVARVKIEIVREDHS